MNLTVMMVMTASIAYPSASMATQESIQNTTNPPGPNLRSNGTWKNLLRSEIATVQEFGLSNENDKKKRSRTYVRGRSRQRLVQQCGA
jgi:hypothetical protein